MNLKNRPFRKNYPLVSEQINSQLDSIMADCISLIGYHDPSGVVQASGAYDRMQERLAIEASGFYNTYTDQVPDTLEIATRLKVYREGVDV
jgi:hypothetical protein